MRILETIAHSLKTQYVHPTTVYNALIVLENNAGIGALADLEFRLGRLVRAMKDRADPATPLAGAWLCATRAYLEEFGTQSPTIPASTNTRSTLSTFMLHFSARAKPTYT